MPKSISVNHKKRKRGRPYAGGKTPQYAFRGPKELIAQVDKWAAARQISRGEAIRELLQIALSVESKSKRQQS